MTFFDFLDKNIWMVTLWLVILSVDWVVYIMEKASRPGRTGK